MKNNKFENSTVLKVIFICSIVLVFIIAVIAVRSMFAHLLLKDIDKMEKINPYPVCDTPEECIDLYIKDYYSGEQNDIKGKYNIGSILYTLYNDSHYAVFFKNENNDDVWYYSINKVEEDGSVKYQMSGNENLIWLNSDEWILMYDDNYYIVTETPDDIEPINNVEPEVTEFELNFESGSKSYYLLVDKNTGKYQNQDAYRKGYY